MTTREVSLELSVSVRRVLALIHAGQLKATRKGRDWHISRASLSNVTFKATRQKDRLNRQCEGRR